MLVGKNHLRTRYTNVKKIYEIFCLIENSIQVDLSILHQSSNHLSVLFCCVVCLETEYTECYIASLARLVSALTFAGFHCTATLFCCDWPMSVSAWLKSHFRWDVIVPLPWSLCQNPERGSINSSFHIG
jgi:hypothetical protein